MKHAREDYNDAIKDVRMLSGAFIKTVTFPVVTGTPIPEDEPVFLLRAQDPFAAEVVAEYANRLQRAARNDADLAFARLATRHADLMAAWPHKKAFPDAPGVNAPELAIPAPIAMTPEAGPIGAAAEVGGDVVSPAIPVAAAPEDNPADDVHEAEPVPEADPDAPAMPPPNEPGAPEAPEQPQP